VCGRQGLFPAAAEPGTAGAGADVAAGESLQCVTRVFWTWCYVSWLLNVRQAEIAENQ
jgi:hypothetical protein